METIEYKGFEIEICRDENAESPRDWDNIGTMVCLHNNYTLGDEQSENWDYANSWREEIAYHLNNKYDIRVDSDGYTKDFLEDNDIEMIYK